MAIQWKVKLILVIVILLSFTGCFKSCIKAGTDTTIEDSTVVVSSSTITVGATGINIEKVVEKEDQPVERTVIKYEKVPGTTQYVIIEKIVEKPVAKPYSLIQALIGLGGVVIGLILAVPVGRLLTKISNIRRP